MGFRPPRREGNISAAARVQAQHPLKLKPDVPLPQIPTAFVYLACWFLMAGVVHYFLGIETKGKSIEQIDKELTANADLATAAVRRA